MHFLMIEETHTEWRITKCKQKLIRREGRAMENLLENEIFVHGIIVGINLHQSRVIEAHKRKEPIKIEDEDELFYLQSGRERLTQMLDQILK